MIMKIHMGMMSRAVLGIGFASMSSFAAEAACTTPTSCKVEQQKSRAKAKIDTKLAASLAASVAPAVAQTLNGAYNSTMYGSDYGMKCDGIDDDTAGLNAVLVAAQANTGAANALASGVKVILPAGLCIISSPIVISVTKSMAFSGLGIGTTHLQWVAATNGLSFIVSNLASLTVDDMTISKKVGTNPTGQTFFGEALSIAAGGPDVTSYGTPWPYSGNVGPVTVANLTVYPGNRNGETDSWAVGVHLTDLSGPTLSNVNVNMPAYTLPVSAMPSPTALGPFNNGANVPTSGTTGAASAAAELGLGVADAVLIQGTDPSSTDPNTAGYGIDAVISNLTTTGGLVGLDLYRFQWVYVSGMKSVDDDIGIRADTPDNTTELLSVINSMFTTRVEGVFANGVAGVNVSSSYFIHSESTSPAMPTYTAIWLRNSTSATVTGNDINGDGNNSLSQEYGIFFNNDADDGAGGFPNTVSSNVLFALNAVCIGNDQHVTALDVTGNSLRGCKTNFADGAAIPYHLDDNSYVGNIAGNHPDMVENSSGLELPEALTVGSFADVGSIKVLSDNLQTFLLDGSGNLSIAGSFSTAGPITTNAGLSATGSIASGGSVSAAGPFSTGNANHMAVEEVVGGFGWGGQTFALTPSTGSLPTLNNVDVMVSGELYCVNNSFRISWRVLGHWLAAAPTSTLQQFIAIPEPDPDTTSALATLGSIITPQANPTSVGVQVSIRSGYGATFDCTADLHELTVN